MIDGENNLTQRAIRGEASAFGLLYGHYQPKIYRFILLKVSRREEAEDLTHQVFLSAWTNIGTYAHRGFPFSSWLYQIARNKVIDHYRAKKNELPLHEIDEEAMPGDYGAVDEMERRLALRKMRAAVKKIKPEYQEIIIMRFVEDLSLKETAVAIGKSEGAVKLLQHRAIKALKDILKETEKTKKPSS